jgi:hypothetical protein
MANVDGRSLSIAEAAWVRGTLVCVHLQHPSLLEPRSRARRSRQHHPQGIGVIMINANDLHNPGDDMAGMQARAKTLGPHVPPCGRQLNVARAFGAPHTPEVFLFDAGRALVYHGAVDDNGREPEKVSCAGSTMRWRRLWPGNLGSGLRTKSIRWHQVPPEEQRLVAASTARPPGPAGRAGGAFDTAAGLAVRSRRARDDHRSRRRRPPRRCRSGAPRRRGCPTPPYAVCPRLAHQTHPRGADVVRARDASAKGSA